MKTLNLIFALFPLLGCNHTESANEQQNKYKQKIVNNEDQKLKSSTYSVQNKPIEIKDGDKKTTPNSSQNIPSKSEDKVKDKIILNVPLVKQNPELRYGCEVTSLSMMLQFAGASTNKMELYRNVKKDADPVSRAQNGDILRWGNPADGFVGDMTGKNAGYAVFDEPIEELVNKYLPGRAVNLTSQSFDQVLAHVSKGYPVVVWTTGDYRLPDRWESWKHGNETIKTPLDLHAVVLVGYDSTHVYINDPLSGRKQVRVSKQQFISSWEALKKRAVSYK